MRYLEREANPFLLGPNDFFNGINQVREQAARLIECPDSQQVAVIPSVSYGMASLAGNISPKPGGNLVLVEDEMPSNYYVWLRFAQTHGLALRIAPRPSSQGEDWTDQLLRQIDAKTVLVSVGNVHWQDGQVFDLFRLKEKLESVGGHLIIDGTQSVGALPLSIRELRPLALVTAGYKWLLGPYSLGFMYVDPSLNGGRPLEDHWLNRKESDRFEALTNYQREYRPGAIRFDMGEASNFVLSSILAESLRYINEVGVSSVYGHCQRLVTEAREGLEDLGFTSACRSPGHYLGMRLPPGVQHNGLKQHYAEHRVAVSLRGPYLRVTPHLYNTTQDIERFLVVTREYLKLTSR